MAKLPPKKPPVAEDLAVSMDQDEFVSGGLPTDFDGEVVEARAVIWNYDNGNGPKLDDEGNPILTLAARLTVKRDDGEDDVVVYHSAGDPAHFVPSDDGHTAADVQEDGTAEGVCFIRTGARTSLSNSTNYAQFLEALKDAESQAPNLARKRTPDIRFLEGLYGHWDRIPQRKRSGMVQREDEGGKRRNNDILVVTQVKAKAQAVARGVVEVRPTSKASAPSRPAQSSTPATTSRSDNPLDEALRAIVLDAVASSNGEGVMKGKLAGKVMSSKALQQAEKAKAVPRITNNAFLESMMEDGLILFDAESGTIVAAEQE